MDMRSTCLVQAISSLIFELYEVQPLKIFSGNLVNSISEVCVTFSKYIASVSLKYSAEILNKIQAEVREVLAKLLLQTF